MSSTQREVKYTLEGIKPGKQPFDLPSAQRPAVLRDRSFSIALVWCDQFMPLAVSL